MANKALNQVSQVQSTELANVKTFLAVMNNGEIKQMSKEDMAAVVGGLIGTATDSKNGLMPAKMYSNNVEYGTTSYRLWELYDVSYNYSCEGAVIDVLGTFDVSQITISTYNYDGALRHNTHVISNGLVLKLFEKDKKVYLYSNQRGNYSKAFIKSTMNIKYITESQEPLDMSSYKEIMLNQ